MKKVMTTTRARNSASSPIRKSRDTKPATKILLATHAGGRCEFNGCNEYLFEDPLTLHGGNFSERAHIVAFSPDGPRGRDRSRPADVNRIENLMLLCQRHHKLIDDHPGDYSRRALEAQKEAHEARVHRLTGLGPEMKTTVVQLKARIAGRPVDIPAPQVYDAVAPRYPVDRLGHIISLTDLDDTAPGFLEQATTLISQRVAELYRPGMDVAATRHISLFALAPIPLLVHLGASLSDKIQVDIFQRHRIGKCPWCWRTSGTPLQFGLEHKRVGRHGDRVALLVSLSGSVHISDLPAGIDRTFSIYELKVENVPPARDILRQREDLDRFRQTYHAALAQLRRDHPAMKALHLFPAVPAPVAVACGHDLLPKIDPDLLVYDYDKARSGFTHQLTVNKHEH